MPLIYRQAFMGGGLVSKSTPSLLEIETEIYFSVLTANGESYWQEEVTLIDTLIKTLKTQNIWSKITLLWFPVGSSFSGAFRALKHPNGIGTLMTNVGFTTGRWDRRVGLDGRTSAPYIDTLTTEATFAPNTDTHMMIAVEDPSATGTNQRRDMGTSSIEGFSLIVSSNTRCFYRSFAANSAIENQVTPTNTRGVCIGSLLNGTARASYAGTVLFTSASSAVTQPPNSSEPITIFRASSITSARILSAASIGKGLTATEMSSYTTALNIARATRAEMATDPFISTWKTDNLSTGSSNNTTISIPLNAIQRYAFKVDWGDGIVEYYTTTNVAAVTHTYAVAGTYTVTIWGEFPRIRFLATGDNLKLMGITQWGSVNLRGTMLDAFRGCLNLKSLPSFPIDASVSVAQGSFTGSGLTTMVPFNSAQIVNFSGTWENCTSLISFPQLSFTNATNMGYAWSGCTNLQTFLSTSFPAATTFTATWQNNTNLANFPVISVPLGQSFNLTWRANTSLVSFPLISFPSANNFNGTWNLCSNLANIPAGLFDNCPCTNFVNAFVGCGLTQQSVDNILVSINSNNRSGGTLNMQGGTSAAPSATGTAARNALVSRGWTITTN